MSMNLSLGGFHVYQTPTDVTMRLMKLPQAKIADGYKDWLKTSNLSEYQKYRVDDRTYNMVKDFLPIEDMSYKREVGSLLIKSGLFRGDPSKAVDYCSVVSSLEDHFQELDQYIKTHRIMWSSI